MKQISQVIIIFSLSVLLYGQAAAQHSGPYAGAFIGGNALLNAKGADSVGNFGLSFDKALTGSAVLGWDFEPGNPAGEGRIELEYSRRSNPLNRARFAEGSFKAGGSVTADSLLVNFFGVHHDGSRFAPYIGAGVGVGRIESASLTVTGAPLANDSAVVLACQLGAGIDYALTDYLNVDLGYRFFSSSKPTFTEVNGHTFAMNYVNHTAVIGLRVGF